MSDVTSRPLPERDFRRPAVAASSRVLAARGLRAAIPNAFSAGVSCCVATGNDAAAILRRTKQLALFGFAGGLAWGMLGGAMILFDPSLREGQAPSLGSSVAGGVCLVLMLATLLVGGVWSNQQAVRQIQPTGVPPAPQCFAVSLEDATTYQKLKAAPEDLGRINFYPERQCVLIEGLYCSYLVFARDVRRLRTGHAPPTRFVLLEYAIGDTLLEIALYDPRLATQFATALFLPRFELHDRIQQTLPFQPPPPPPPPPAAARPVPPPPPPGAMGD